MNIFKDAVSFLAMSDDTVRMAVISFSWATYAWDTYLAYRQVCSVGDLAPLLCRHDSMRQQQ